MDDVRFRSDLNNINIEYFGSPKSLDDSVKFFNTEVKCMCEKHAPLKHKTITVNKNQPWFDAELK